MKGYSVASQSLELTPLDFFHWEYLKSRGQKEDHDSAAQSNIS